jgi:hypothetical protein
VSWAQNHPFPIEVSRWLDHQRLKKTTAEQAEFESLVGMKSSANVEAVIVGIFDNAQDLDRAEKGLAAAGFEGTVYDEAIIADDLCEANPVSVGPVLAPAVFPTDGSGGLESDSPAIHAFKSHLADCHLSDEVIDAYVTAFSHKGRFLLVKTEPECARHIIEILRACHASRVNRHDLEGS